MKTVTVNGKRYSLSLGPAAAGDVRVWVRGPGILSRVPLPPGITLASPDLRQQVAQTLATYREMRAAAAAHLRQMLRGGQTELPL